MEPPPSKKHRRLNYEKCKFCRQAKKKCEPVDRQWPFRKCDRCIDEGLECSENQQAPGPRAHTPSLQSSITISTSLERLYDISLRHTWLKKLRLFTKAGQTIADEREHVFERHDPKAALLLAKISKCIQNEEIAVISDTDSLLCERLPPEQSFAARQLLSSLFAGDGSVRENYEDNVLHGHITDALGDCTTSAQSIGDLGSALTMQELHLIHLMRSGSQVAWDTIDLAMQNYLKIHHTAMQRLSKISRHELLPVPAFHNLLQLTKGNPVVLQAASLADLVGEKDLLGRTLLHFALDLNADVTSITWATELNRECTTEDGFGRLPIHIACSFQSLGLKRPSGQFSATASTTTSSTGGQLISSSNAEAVITSLLNNGADINAVDSSGYHLLSHAAVHGRVDIMRLLIKEGADINAENKFAGTPLHMAAQGGQKAIAKLLIKEGADINAENDFAGTPLHKAASGGHWATVKLLIKKGANIDANSKCDGAPLHMAARGGHEATVMLLIENGANINANSSCDGAPLHLAARGGHEATVKLLIENGADINAVNEYGGTPLHVAARGGHEATVKLLIKKGANIDANSRCDGAPLHVATRGGHEATVKLLIENGANINANSRNDGAPLHLAARSGHEAIAKLLVENGADINANNEYSGTPLHVALRCGHWAVTELLIEKGADSNTRTTAGETPIEVAAQRGQKAAFELLIEKRFSMTARNEVGQGPVYDFGDEMYLHNSVNIR